MASHGYWTASDSYPPEGLKKYHLFLDETFPSSAFRGAKLVNENLTVCLDFNPDYDHPKPVVCHPIKESDIPSTNNSIMDAGFYVVSDKLNESAARRSCNFYFCTIKLNQVFAFEIISSPNA